MLTHIINIFNYIIESFIHIWPYLLLTIPIAVAVKMSGASMYIERAFTARPIIAIFLATLVGAFSPLCSCSVIPVIAALLIGGVPLAPVMSFWLASPSMDPEIFLLTVSSLGWELAIWRMAATLIMSLGGGLITHYLIKKNLLGDYILKDVSSNKVKTFSELIRQIWQFMVMKVKAITAPSVEHQLAGKGISISLPQSHYTGSNEIKLASSPETHFETSSLLNPPRVIACSCESIPQETPSIQQAAAVEQVNPCCGSEQLTTPVSSTEQTDRADFWKRLARETWSATTMVIKFMLIAWFIGAIIRLYVPESWIISTLGGRSIWAILYAAFLGIPVYTGNLMALPLVGGLLEQGMNPGAALAFLISGPTTTLPAMSAVYGLVNRRVFGLYIGFSLVTAVMVGLLNNLFM